MDRFGQNVHHPLYDSLAKSVVVSGEEGIANEDGDGNEDDNSEKLKIKLLMEERFSTTSN
jgi:hypothetical protein